LAYLAQGRYADAEPLYRRASAVRESARSRPVVAQWLNGLAVLYNNQGRHADSEPLYKRE
jgi:hypothetical protein